MDQKPDIIRDKRYPKKIDIQSYPEFVKEYFYKFIDNNSAPLEGQEYTAFLNKKIDIDTGIVYDEDNYLMNIPNKVQTNHLLTEE